jgi:hypothetical protein
LKEIKGRRIDLTKTEKYLTGCFKELLKLLLLAGIDPFDKELMQIQERFQMYFSAQCRLLFMKS